MSASSHGGDAAPVSIVVADAGADSPAPDPRLVADLVTANHILYHQHVVDAFGHISVRHDKDPEKYVMSRHLAPVLVTAGDLLMTTVLRIPRHCDLLAQIPVLESYRLRCESRPAFKRALAAHMADFSEPVSAAS